jgi:uncharacterized protein involved in type VI secretion and phage assembly
MTERMKGVVIGLVTDRDDPEGLGRIRVAFPWLGDDAVSNWARVAAPLAGSELGHFFQPEVGDEALVAFEMGDVNRPYILGYLWNGDNAPPGDDPNVRLIQTVSGHKLSFDDSGGSEAITIEDASGNNKIVMNADGITIESTRDVTIKGVNVTIEASAKLAAKGNPIHLNP